MYETIQEYGKHIIVLPNTDHITECSLICVLGWVEEDVAGFLATNKRHLHPGV